MLKRILKITVVAVVLLFVAVQFIRPQFSNPPVVESDTMRASTQMPPEVQQILARSCADCHSNETAYPWYTRITPVNWLLADHIDTGRHELNLSVWNTYSKEKKMRKLDEICEQVELGAMPVASYLWMHRDAALTKSDIDLLCGWTKAERERVATQTF